MLIVPLLLAQGIAAPGGPGAAGRPRVPARRDIAPPSQRSVEPSGGAEILPPQDSGVHGRDVETPMQRRKRLEEAGIVAPPPPRKRVPTGWERYADALNPAAETDGGAPMPQGLRFDANAGSWFVLHAPEETRYVPDFSYGFSVLWPLESTVEAANGRYRSVFVGGSATFLNGGTYQAVEGGYRGKGTNYADTNSSEWGLDLVLAQETFLSPWLAFGTEGRATWAPVRQVRSRYESYAQNPGRSEVGSHTRFNWAGLGFGVSGVFTVARVVGAGLFGSVSLANPMQARARVGITFLMATTRPPPKAGGDAPEGSADGTSAKDPKASKPEGNAPAGTPPAANAPPENAPAGNAPARGADGTPTKVQGPEASPERGGGAPGQTRTNSAPGRTP